MMAEKQEGSVTKSGNKPERKCSATGNVQPKFRHHGLWKELAALTDLRTDKGVNCQVCYVRCSTGRTLKRHLDRFRDRKYPCEECGTRFCDAEVLRSHVRDAHEFVRLMNYKAKCPVCDQRFCMEANLRSHLCHYHCEWVDAKLRTFISRPSADGTETEAVNSSGSRQTLTMRSRQRYLTALMRDVIKTTSKDNEETLLAGGKNARSRSFDDGYWKSDVKRKSFSDENATNLSVAEAWNNIRKEPWKPPFGDFSDCNKVQRDAKLRILYSCRDCYVPLTRIDATRNKRPIESVTSNYRDDDAENRRKSRKRVKESQRKRKRSQSSSTGFEMPLVTFFNTVDVLKTESNDCEMPYEPPDALEDCVDPLDFGSVENNCNYGESSRETTHRSLVEQSASFGFPMKTEFADSFLTSISEQATESRNHPVANIPFKAEPMDCGVEEDSVITESSEKASKPNIPGIKEVDDFSVTSYSQLDTSATYTGALDTSMKIEIEEHAISEHSDQIEFQAECDTEKIERLGTLHNHSSQVESNTFSESENEKSQPNRTMIASKICDMIFASRRAMLRHFRDIHLSCLGETVICICGKNMIGRRALENHFSRHCDSVVRTSRPESYTRTVCKALDKKFMCAKCGERFWLESCLYDHPPDCELQKPALPKPNGLTSNFHKTYGIVSQLRDTVEYVCRICQSKFMSAETLMRHVRSFTAGENHPCPICRTVFPGARLLKAHIQAAHVSNFAITYPYSCGVCRQGFSKMQYKRIHMMHIHSKTIKSSDVPPTECQEDSPMAAEYATGNQCNVCNLVFASHKRFVDHTSYYNKSKVFRCNICGQSFSGQFKVHHHRKRDHYGKVQSTYAHRCDICTEGFMYKTHLHAHKVHVHDKELIALTKNTGSEDNIRTSDGEFAGRRLPDKFSTNSHQVHIEPVRKPAYKCDQCDMDFLNWSGWKFHLTNAHPTSRPVDPSNFPTKRNVTISSEFIGSGVDESMSGGNSDCLVDPTTGELAPRGKDGREGFQSSAPGSIHFNHNVLAAMNDLKSSLCTICGFDCPGPWGLSKHKAMFLNSGMYTCEFCGRRFSRQSFYRDHKLKHFRRDVYNKCFCPVCDEGFENVRSLEMHTIHLHQQTLHKLELAAKHDSSSKLVDETMRETYNLTTCQICRMVFMNIEKLKHHLRTYHSLPDAKDSAIQKRSDTTGDRFYVTGGANAHAQTANGAGNIGNKTEGLTTYLYRYDASLTCKDCDITFTSKYMLDGHHEIVHKMRTNLEVGNVIVQEEPQASQTKAIKLSSSSNPLPLSGAECRPEANTAPFSTKKAIEVSKRDHKASSRTEVKSSSGSAAEYRSSSSSNSLPLSGAQSQSKVNEASTKVVERSGVNNIKTSQTTQHSRVVNSYQCRKCDILFVDKNLLTAHERNVHHLFTGDGEGTDHSPSAKHRRFLLKVSGNVNETHWNSSSAIQQPATQAAGSTDKDKRTSTTMAPEEITISDDDTRGSGELSAAGDPLSLDKTIKPMRLVHLPPGKYKIAKLKVRSVDTTARSVLRRIEYPSKKP